MEERENLKRESIALKRMALVLERHSVCRQKEIGIKKFRFPIEILRSLPLNTYLSQVINESEVNGRIHFANQRVGGTVYTLTE